MSEDTQTTTEEISDNESPVTEAENSGKAATPAVELRDNKVFVDGVRMYTRDDTNRIAANAKREAESSLLSELGVEDLNSVKTVISQLQNQPSGEENALNIDSLRDAVKKREQTVEELKAELNQLRVETTLKTHISNLQSEMPGNWNADQRQAVLDLMRARDMLVMEGDAFAICNGNEFITDSSGESPDYAAAVQLIGKQLGLPLAKTGVTSFDTDRTPGESKPVKLDESRINSDSAYRSAYIAVREQNRNLSRDQITDQMVKKQMERSYGTAAQRTFGGVQSQTNKTSKRR